MRNIFVFIGRYFNFLFFLVMQIVALSMLFRYNTYHEAMFMNAASGITGKLNEKYNTIEYYFRLKAANSQLVRENERLNQELRQNYEAPDSAKRLFTYNVSIDSTDIKSQKWLYMEAKVVNNTTASQTNFLTIHRGSAEGVRVNSGVVGTQGIVGFVISVSKNYAGVMSMLNRQFKAVVNLKNGGDRGTIEWDGNSTQFVTLKNIPKSAKVNKGDTVVTSTLSSFFPPDVMVGTVSEIVDDRSSNFYTLKIRLATDFSSIEYVYVTVNTQADEQKSLEDSTRKKLQ
ncbi:MAG TPA: rod shape-determining protein MreC [Puia sp.]|nr:rod shape-determining protein MreC [Puia sp.]